MCKGKIVFIAIIVLFVFDILSVFYSGNTSHAEEIEIYTLTFDANGGSFGVDSDGKAITIKNVTINKGDSVDLSNYQPSREGYSFLGWKKSTSNDDEYFKYDVSTPDADTTYIAGWKYIYKVRFDANGGYFSYKKTIDGDEYVYTIDEEYEDGTEIGSSSYSFPIPIREGYKLFGYKEENNDKLYYGSLNSYTVCKDTVLYAQWGAPRTVTYVFGNETQIINCYEGDTITVGYNRHLNHLMSTCDKACGGWKDSNGVLYTCGERYTVKDNITFYLQYKYVRNIKYNNNGGLITVKDNAECSIKYCENPRLTERIIPLSPSSYSASLSKYFPETYKDYSITTYALKDDELLIGAYVYAERKGYSFVGWKSSSDNKIYKSKEKIKVTKDVTFTAIWKIDKKIHKSKDGEYYYLESDIDEDLLELYDYSQFVYLDKKTHAYYRISSTKRKNGKVINGEVTYLKPESSKNKSIKVPNSIKIYKQKYDVSFVEYDAYKNCKKLKKLVIGDKVKYISIEFSGCKKLETVILGKKVHGIYNKGFNKCKNLKYFEIKSTKIDTITKKSFKGVNKNIVFKLPKSKTSKYKKLLKKAGAPKTAIYK